MDSLRQAHSFRIFYSWLGAVLAFSILPLVAMGCTASRAAPRTGGAPVKNVNSKGLTKLSPEDIEKKIQAVQADKTIPDSAKANVIQSIRAQGEP